MKIRKFALKFVATTVAITSMALVFSSCNKIPTDNNSTRDTELFETESSVMLDSKFLKIKLVNEYDQPTAFLIESAVQLEEFYQKHKAILDEPIKSDNSQTFKQYIDDKSFLPMERAMIITFVNGYNLDGYYVQSHISRKLNTFNVEILKNNGSSNEKCTWVFLSKIPRETIVEYETINVKIV